jgi:hypothetical protein
MGHGFQMSGKCNIFRNLVSSQSSSILEDSINQSIQYNMYVMAGFHYTSWART